MHYIYVFIKADEKPASSVEGNHTKTSNEGIKNKKPRCSEETVQ